MKLAWIVVGIALMVSAQVSRAEPLSPLVGDWQSYFRIDTDSTARDGRVIVSGKVLNVSAWSAKRIQLLVEGLDADGQPVAQRVIWLGIDLGAGAHAFFDAPMAPAASYRVRVFAFDSSRGRWG